MKKTAFALSLLLGMALLSFWNLRHLEKLTGELCEGVVSVRQHCREGDFTAAEAALDETLDRWLGSDGYTHIFIRHCEIDAASDIFYDLWGDVLAGDGEGAEADAEKLLYHLQSIYGMERISLKSIF